MSRTYKDSRKRRKSNGEQWPRQIAARAVRRDQPDLRKLARAAIQLALAEAEAEAQQTETAPDKTDE